MAQQKYNSFGYQIYQDPSRYNRNYCKVVLGNRRDVGHIMLPNFKFFPGEVTLDIALNGDGVGKALKKVREALRDRGDFDEFWRPEKLEDLVISETTQA